MALNINTNLTNNLDGYLVDAKNVKGTYVVVQNYSDLANLPSACVVNGTLAYVSNDNVDATENNGFWQYNGSTWVKKQLESKVVSINVSDNEPDPTQTYTFTISGNELFTLIEGARLRLNFYQAHQPIFIFYPTLLQDGATTQQSNIVCIFDNKQYIATIHVDLSQQSNNATLSFQELQASGGGGGSTTTKKWYKWSLEDEDSSSYTINTYAYLTENDMQELYTGINSAMGTSISTPQEIVALYNQMKMDDYTLSQQTEEIWIQLNMMFGFAVSRSMENNKLTRLYVQDSDTLYYPTISFAMGNLVSSVNTSGDSNNHAWFVIKKSDSIENISFSSGSTLTITEETEVIGGGSSTSTGGSGKLYELSMEITRYGMSGSTTWNSQESITLQTLPLTMCIYESNWGSIKEKVNNLIELINAQLHTNIPLLTDINSLVSFINMYVNETVAYEISIPFSFLTYIIPLCDKTYFTYNNSNFVLSANGDFNLIFPYAGRNDYFNMFFEYNDFPYTYGLNVNNSCTLTEYGTSGSGGSQPVASSGVDYVQIHSGGADNCLIFTFEKGMMDTPTMVSNINAGITGLNTQLGLSIPSYTELSDLTDICTYINSLSSSYLQVKVIFWASMFNFMSYVCLSVKGQINGEICPISIEAVADSNNNNYTFAVKYLSVNSSPFGYVDWFSPTTWLSPEPSVLVNQLD